MTDHANATKAIRKVKAENSRIFIRNGISEGEIFPEDVEKTRDSEDKLNARDTSIIDIAENALYVSVGWILSCSFIDFTRLII